MTSKFSETLARRLFQVSLAVVVLGGAFLAGVVAHWKDLAPVPQLRTAYQTLTSTEDSDLLQHPRRHHLQPTRGQGSGVTVNAGPDDGALVYMAGFFDEESQIRLIRRDGTLFRSWSLNYFDHFPDPATRVCDVATPLRVDSMGNYMNPQGEIVLNYSYCGSVKIDQCGNVLWRLSEPTHHPLIPAAAGGYWLMGRDVWPASSDPDRFPPFSTPGTETAILEDTVLRVGEDGEILEEYSIPALMRENGLEAVLTANGEEFGWDRVLRAELVHANKITELSAELADAFPLFAAGDLAISMRAHNFVMVIDPVTKEVKWSQMGPWLRQHDPEFRPDGRISIFNNNVYRTGYRASQTLLETPFATNIMAVDPVTGETEVVFGERPGQEMLSVIRGDHQLLPDDGMLITEFDAGRVLEVDAQGRIVWEYVNAYDADFVGEITNAAIIPAGFVQADWTTCEG